MKKLKKLLKLKEITTPEEQKDCWLFDKILYAQICKLVKAKDRVDYNIYCLRENYREKAMILLSGKHPQSSPEFREKKRELEENPYFKGLLFKQKRMQEKWGKLADECRILNDLYLASNPAFLEKWNGNFMKEFALLVNSFFKEKITLNCRGYASSQLKLVRKIGY